MLLMIDNYDSFTYNLVQYLGELGEEVRVFRNDAITLDEIEHLQPSRIMISPGPCTPVEAGISVDCVTRFMGRTPILGVCLGHQAIGVALGGRVIRAHEPLHGKLSQVKHDGQGLFANLPQPLHVTRYHSLILERDSLPGSLRITGESDDAERPTEIMAITHHEWPLVGVQFHPESILTQCGHELLRNFLENV